MFLGCVTLGQAFQCISGVGSLCVELIYREQGVEDEVCSSVRSMC